MSWSENGKWSQWSVRGRRQVYNPWPNSPSLHTYLDGVGPFKEPGLRPVEIPHSTATLSSGGGRSLYGLRLMHRPNIFQSLYGLSMG